MKFYQASLFIAILFSCPLALANEDSLCTQVKTVAKQGDLLFLGIKDPFGVFPRVAEINDSWVNHVGIVMKDLQDNWIVRESSFPKAKDTEICSFLHRTTEGRIALRRLRSREFTSEDLALMNAEMNPKMGAPYDLKFDYYKEKYQFCSKFVHQVYLKIGVEAGALQTLEEIFKTATNREQKVEFWVHWFGGSIPWQQITVTPYSQYIDPKFDSVLDTSSSSNVSDGK